MRLIKPMILCAIVALVSANLHAAPQDRATREAVRDLIVSLDAKAKEPPVGTWVRETTVNGAKVKLTFEVEADRLRVTYADKTHPSYYLLDCDYGVTKDFVLFGVVNSVDGEPSERPTDKPFRMRYRVDGDSLTIKDVSMENCPGIVSRMEGRYTLAKKK